MKRTLFVATVAAAFTAAVALPVQLLADAASCSLMSSSYANSIINQPKGEDTDFFVNSGGVPNIMFILDTSGSMLDLPPNGAAAGWGLFEKSGNATAGDGYGCTNAYANVLTYNSPCGTTLLDGRPYNPKPGSPPPDYYNGIKDAAGNFCPYMIPGNATQRPGVKTDKPGFDPDFPGFFPVAPVYRDGAWNNSSAGTEAATTEALFCATFAGAKATSCTSCMRDQGYFYDGTYATTGSEPCDITELCTKRGKGTCINSTTKLPHEIAGTMGGVCREPTVYFAGNFLNFYPPKFIIARKVMKDVLQVVRRIRLGLTVFNAPDGGKLLWDLSPTCSLSLKSNTAFDSNRSSLLSAINNNKLIFAGGTPLAETLLNVGQYYSTLDNNWFDSTFQNNTEFAKAAQKGNGATVCFSCQASAVLLITDGMASLDGKIPGPNYAPKAMTKAEADKVGNYGGMTGFNITDISAADCPECNNPWEDPDPSIGPNECIGNQTSGGCDDGWDKTQAYLPKVAWYLHNMDLRDDAEGGYDGYAMTGKQSVTTYTIGLGTRGNTSKMLQDAATAGGGLFNGGSGGDITDARSLRDAILSVLESVNSRSTSFGAASLSTLQVAAAQGVLVPRFEPSRSAHWDGHLYSFALFSEFSSGKCVIPASGASGPANGDLDCDGKCTSVFLKDSEGSFIQEDATGSFMKNKDSALTACGPGNRCTTCTGPGTTSAVPYWDAGAQLKPSATGDSATHAWNQRSLFTVIDDTADNRLDAKDALIDLRTFGDYAKLVPYLNIRGNTFCSKLSSRLSAAGNTVGATIDTELTTGVYTSCAKAIMDFVRGADIFNEHGITPFPATYKTRAYQLGDIFHSSPIEVVAPLASDGFLCIRGLHNQCLPSLFSQSIPNPAAVAGHANAYDDYAKFKDYKHRNKFTLVGANDGMIHAIKTGTWHPVPCTDPNPDPPDECAPPFEGYYDAGTGEELWGFIPPDLLAKLKQLLENQHQYFVDGTPMIRDVWVDGGFGGDNLMRANRASGSVPADGARSAGEFHTVAIVGERRGGTHYFALDVTDAGDDLGQKPKFLWIYPQPNDPEQLSFGETFIEFLPKPPPIGPVRIDAGAPPCGAGTKEYSGSAGTRCFTERWVAFLSGGFDQQYTRGRGVHMVEIGTGKELFDFSQPPGPASSCDATKDPRCHLNYPVAATVGMMMWGKETNFLSAASVDGYFDTATFGDTGGQMWLLRFNDPGVIDPGTGKVNNWFGARVFQNGLTAATPACGLDYCGGQPFFYITSNLPLAANGLYRTFAGTGDRFNLLDQLGGTCGPDNIRACLQKGCTVKLLDATGGPGAKFGVEPLLGTQTFGADLPASCSGLDASKFTQAVTVPGATSCTTVTSRIDNLLVTCPAALTCSKEEEEMVKRTSVTCSGGDSCEPSGTNQHGMPIGLAGTPTSKNWFFSLQVFENSGARKIFTTAGGAVAYDAARLKEADLADVNAADAAVAVGTTPTWGDPGGKGWKYFFNHGSPNTPDVIKVGGADHKIYRADERNASVSAIEGGCTFWNTMQSAIPTAGLVTGDPEGCQNNSSPCKAGKAQVSYLYGASPGTGANCLIIDGVSKRSNMSESLVPPNIGKLVAYVSSGQVSFGLTSVRIPQGGSNVSLGEAQDLSSQMGWRPITKEEHMCRHAPKGTPPDPNLCK